MSITIHADPVPLRADESGEVLVGGSRVLLATLLNYHQQGMTPEALAENFPSVSLADIHSALGYYHRHKAELDAWMAERNRELDELRCQVEAAQRHRLTQLKAKLDDYQAKRSASDAPTGV